MEQAQTPCKATTLIFLFGMAADDKMYSNHKDKETNLSCPNNRL